MNVMLHAGIAFDPCYHAASDTYADVSASELGMTALDE
jgi:hypothetical protein